MLFKVLIAAVILAIIWRWWGSWTRGKSPRHKSVTRTAHQGVDDAQAYHILGIDPGASVEEIRAAHRRLITGIHPDRGGSSELTRQVNAARDQLLRSNG